MLNCPLKYTDPTGHSSELPLFKAIKKGYNNVKSMLGFTDFKSKYEYTVKYNSILTDEDIKLETKREILGGLENTLTDKYNKKYSPKDFKHYTMYDDVSKEDLTKLNNKINNFIDSNLNSNNSKASVNEGLKVFQNFDNAYELSTLVIANEGVKIEKGNPSFSTLGKTGGIDELITKSSALKVSISKGIKLNGIQVEDIDSYSKELKDTFFKKKKE